MVDVVKTEETIHYVIIIMILLIFYTSCFALKLISVNEKPFQRLTLSF